MSLTDHLLKAQSEVEQLKLQIEIREPFNDDIVTPIKIGEEANNSGEHNIMDHSPDLQNSPMAH